MSKYDPQLSKELRDAVKAHGFDPYADIIPSAAGRPFKSALSPKAFNAHSRKILDQSRELIEQRARLAQ